MTANTRISIDPVNNNYGWQEVDEFLFLLKTIILCFDPRTTFEGVQYAITKDRIDIVTTIKSRLKPDLWHDMNAWLAVINKDEQLLKTFRTFLNTTGLSERLQRSIYAHKRNMPEFWLLPSEAARSLIGIPTND